MSEVLRLYCRMNLLAGRSPVRLRTLLTKVCEGFLAAVKYV